jgi:phosphoribosylpyrophosphate synthetase
VGLLSAQFAVRSGQWKGTTVRPHTAHCPLRTRLTRSAGRIFAVATHGVFSGDAFSRLRDSGIFAAIAATNSHPHALALRSEGLIVRSCAPLFAAALR